MFENVKTKSALLAATQIAVDIGIEAGQINF